METSANQCHRLSSSLHPLARALLLFNTSIFFFFLLNWWTGGIYCTPYIFQFADMGRDSWPVCAYSTEYTLFHEPTFCIHAFVFTPRTNNTTPVLSVLYSLMIFLNGICQGQVRLADVVTHSPNNNGNSGALWSTYVVLSGEWPRFSPYYFGLSHGWPYPPKLHDGGKGIGRSPLGSPLSWTFSWWEEAVNHHIVCPEYRAIT